MADFIKLYMKKKKCNFRLPFTSRIYRSGTYVAII